MELTSLQRFFLISGVGAWFIIGILILCFIAYLIVKPISEPRTKPIDTTGIQFTYDSKGNVKQLGKELRAETAAKRKAR